MKNIALVLTLFVALVAFKPESGYKVGDKATDFKLKNVDGKMVSLADYSTAKGFIVIFTCNHCPFSKKYEDRIVALDKAYKEKGYPVIAINSNDAAQNEEDSYQNMRVRAREKQFTFPYLHDETQEMAKTYGATRTPHVFILQKEAGSLIVKYIGAIDDNSDDAAAVKEKYAEKALDNLIAGKAVETTTTKAIGCTIKWKN
ncbi:MAG: thioredoxin family protein [Chitinophagales bacterium]